jgi:uncharacterized protein DUF1566
MSDAAQKSESSKAKEISLGDDFDAAVVQGRGVTVEWAADGSVIVYTNGSVKVKPAPANDTGAKAKAAPQVGDKVDDGTVFVGTSPETGKAMYATPADAKLTYTFNQAKDYAATLDANGHQDWRVPSKSELNVLFSSRAAIGGFNETGSGPAGWYWSSSPLYGLHGWAQRFSDGGQYGYVRGNVSSLRCVR